MTTPRPADQLTGTAPTMERHAWARTLAAAYSAEPDDALSLLTQDGSVDTDTLAQVDELLVRLHDDEDDRRQLAWLLAYCIEALAEPAYTGAEAPGSPDLARPAVPGWARIVSYSLTRTEWLPEWWPWPTAAHCSRYVAGDPCEGWALRGTDECRDHQE